MKSVYLVVNPVSGSGKSGKLYPEIEEYMKSVGYDVTTLVSKQQGDIARITSNIPSTTSVIAVMGGDGTVNEAVQGLGDRAIPILVLAVGTANVIARELSLPFNAMEAAKILADDSKLIGWDTAKTGNRRMLFSVSAGFDAATVHRVSEVRKGALKSWLAYIPPALHTFTCIKPTPIKLQVDGEYLPGEFVYFLALNTTRYAGGFKVMESACINDGQLNLLAVRKKGVLKYFEIGTRMAIGKLKDNDDIVLTSFKHLRAESSDDVPVQIDGEEHGFLPIDIHVIKNGCRFLVPAHPKPGFREKLINGSMQLFPSRFQR